MGGVGGVQRGVVVGRFRQTLPPLAATMGEARGKGGAGAGGGGGGGGGSGGGLVEAAGGGRCEGDLEVVGVGVWG